MPVETKRLNLPRFAELPRVELYMDQVLLILDEALPPMPLNESVGKLKTSKSGKTERPLTASMINNYVKQGLIEPPQKKRYTREQVAALLLISLLKNLLPIADIRLLLQAAAAQGLPNFYDSFCKQLTALIASPAADWPTPDNRTIDNLAQTAAQALAQKFYLQKLLHA